jgi:hypothetical protein
MQKSPATPAPAPARKPNILDLAFLLTAFLVGKTLKRHGVSAELAADLRKDLAIAHRVIVRGDRKHRERQADALAKVHPEFAALIRDELAPAGAP